MRRVWLVVPWLVLLAGLTWVWFVGWERFDRYHVRRQHFRWEQVSAFLYRHPRTTNVDEVVRGFLRTPNSKRIRELAEHWQANQKLRQRDRIPTVVWEQLQRQGFINQLWVFITGFPGTPEAELARQRLQELVAECRSKGQDVFLLWREVVADQTAQTLLPAVETCLVQGVGKGELSADRLRVVLNTPGAGEALQQAARAALARQLRSAFPFDRPGDQAVAALLQAAPPERAARVLLDVQWDERFRAWKLPDTEDFTAHLERYMNYLAMEQVRGSVEADITWLVRWKAGDLDAFWTAAKERRIPKEPLFTVEFRLAAGQSGEGKGFSAEYPGSIAPDFFERLGQAMPPEEELRERLVQEALIRASNRLEWDFNFRSVQLVLFQATESATTTTGTP